MKLDSADKAELEALVDAYRQAVEEVVDTEVDDVVRVARLLEVDAQFLGLIAACRERISARAAPPRKRRH
jgi:hypothetical protein